MKNQKIGGIFLSYAATVVQIIINFCFTPFLINHLGINEYGLYQTISSLAGNLTILNFGTATIMSRNLVKYRLNKDNNDLENFLFLGSVMSLIISVIIFIMGLVLGMYISPLYGESLSSQDLYKAKYMFFYLVLNLSVIVWNNMFSGVSIGYEKFIFTNFLKLFRQILRVVLIIILILSGKDSIAIVIADVIVSVVLLLIEIIYCFLILKVKIKFHYFDKSLMLTILTFSLASFLQTITNQINLNLDRVILGVMTTTNIVALYSVALLILNTLISVTKIISSVYLPEATKLVIENADCEDFTELIIRVGRIQNIICSGIVMGFFIMGKEFLFIWVGEEYVQIWGAIMILLIPSMFSCVITVANVIIDAKMKKIVRSVILIITSIINLFITIILIEKFSYLGAAIGTAFSIIVGDVILMNLYYKVLLKINIIRIYKEIFKGILPAAVFSAFLAVGFNFNNELHSLIIKAVVFSITYFITLINFGINKKEKRFLVQKAHGLKK